MARWVRSGLSVSGPFVCRCLIIRTVLRFHIPLIEPDKRVSRIRLPEETSRVRPRKAAFPCRETNQAKAGIQAGFRKLLHGRPHRLMLDTQPPTQPSTGVLINGPIGFTDRPKTEVICPTVHHLVELGYHSLVVQ